MSEAIRERLTSLWRDVEVPHTNGTKGEIFAELVYASGYSDAIRDVRTFVIAEANRVCGQVDGRPERGDNRPSKQLRFLWRMYEPSRDVLEVARRLRAFTSPKLLEFVERKVRVFLGLEPWQPS